MRFKEVALSSASPEAKIAGLAVLLDKELLRLSEVVLNTKKLQGPQGEQGLQGPKGEQGDRGFDGANGKDGSDGKDGKDGHEGKDGVGVQDAKIDFDGSLVITLTNGREINAGDVVPEGVADKIKVIKSGGGNSQTVLDAIEEIQATIATYGTMATQNANAVAITGGSINGTTIGAAVPATGVFTTLTASALTATGQTSLGGAAGANNFRVLGTAGTINYWQAVGGDGATTNPRLSIEGTSTNTSAQFASKGTGVLQFITNGTSNLEQMRVGHTASAVNYVQVTGAATTAFPTISAQGSDSAVSLGLTAKGGNAIIFFTNSGSNRGLRVSHTASSVNYVDVSGSATGSVPVIGNAGSDSNIGLALKTTGTGAIDLAAGSRGVNISNGGTVTALTVTAAGSGYTTIPTPAITAPTTAGGVQAVATATMNAINRTIVSGGTGYTLNDTITVVGGTFTTAATFTVSAVSGGVVTALAASNGGTYSVLPTGTLSTTGGTGTGLTLTIDTWGVRGLTIGTAGSGYVEQPTVTFSGGGGSGAAAYASVGAGSVIRSLGSTGTQSLSFHVPSGEVLRLRDTGSTGTYVLVNTTASGANVLAQGSTNAFFGFNSNGTGNVDFGTNGNTGNTQLRVAHTASAVNYVQVTGAATGSGPKVIAQGSDTNINLDLQTKGTGYVNLLNNRTNYFQFYGGNTGQSPTIYAWGSDTNIDLNLTPKGTGNVRFGTLTASADAAITGYITIKDSGGTVRKLAVIA